MKLVNEYYPDSEIRNFPDMEEKFQTFYDIKPELGDIGHTVRFMAEGGAKIGYRDILYYISWLYDNNPTTVIDVGCGEFIFKNWFPKLIGLSPINYDDPYHEPDIIGYFNEEFSKAHTEQYDCAMAINSVHYVTWDKLENLINLAMNIIKLGGRFLFTMNLKMVSPSLEYNIGIKYPSSLEDKASFVYDLIVKTGHKIVLFDCPHIRGYRQYYSMINGDVRFILEKTSCTTIVV